jgi:hypothetical protein
MKTKFTKEGFDFILKILEILEILIQTRKAEEDGLVLS